MKTTINGKQATWSKAIKELWFEVSTGIDKFVVTANWFTARPYVDEYNRGSEHEGFVYTTLEGYTHHVYTVQWRVGKPSAAYVEPSYVDQGEDR